MAYKFQLGAAKLSGSIEQTDGDFLTAKTEFRIGNAQVTEVELEKLDGITNGTVAENKAVVVDGNKDATSFRNIGATQLSASAKLLAGGDITGSGGIQVIDASGLAGTALEDDGLGKLKISDGGVTNDMLAGSIANGKLANSAVTVTAGDGLQGGGSVSLGGSVTLNIDVDVMAGVGLTADNTNEELDVSSAQTGIESILNNSLKIGYGATDAHIDFSSDNNIIFDIDNAEKFRVDSAGVDVAGIISGSGNLLVGGEITGSSISLMDASGLAGTALEDDTTGKLKISDGGVTNDMLAGSIANGKLANSAITIAGSSTSLGGSISAATIASAIDSETMSLTGVADLDGAQANLTIFDTLNAERTLTIGASNGTVAIAGNLTVNGTTTTVNSTSIEITGSFVFEGSSPNDFETTFGVVNPTADRAVNLADSAGTLVPFSDVPAAGVQITASPAELNLLDAGAGSSVGLLPGDGFIMFDASDSNSAKKVLMSDISTFVGNAISTTVQSVTSATHTLDVTAGQIVICNRASGVTLTLDSAGNMDGVKMLIKRQGTGNITITTPGSETIDGSSGDIVLESAGAAVTIFSDGTNYFIA